MLLLQLNEEFRWFFAVRLAHFGYRLLPSSVSYHSNKFFVLVFKEIGVAAMYRVTATGSVANSV